MKRLNLSTIGNKYHIVFDGPAGVEYWAGGTDFVPHPNDGAEQAVQVGAHAAMHWINYLTDRGIQARYEYVDGDYNFVYWPDAGWVVLNHRERQTTVHRVYAVCGGEDENWTTDVSVEGFHIKHGEDLSTEIVISDGEIIDVHQHYEGKAHSGFTSFNISTKSNLQYRFEFDPTPIED